MTMRVYTVTPTGVHIEHGSTVIATGEWVDYMGSAFPPCSCPRCRRSQ